MRVTLITKAKPPWRVAMLAGFAAHSVSVEIIKPRQPRLVRLAKERVGPRDILAVWGWKLGDAFGRRGCRVLVMEGAPVGDRNEWLALGWSGIKNRAICPAIADKGARWREHFGDVVQPWKTGGSYALIVGQVTNDVSLNGIDVMAWYAEAAARARERFGLPAMFRPHPVELTTTGTPTQEIPGAVTLLGSLDDALAAAAVAVTYNSNVGTVAALAGVPVIACDEGSTAWDVAAHGLDGDIVRPDRAAWCAQLAWRQWSVEEVSDGAAWQHMLACMP